MQMQHQHGKGVMTDKETENTEVPESHRSVAAVFHYRNFLICCFYFSFFML